MQSKFIDDIDIKFGKTYLVYFEPEQYYHNKESEYEICGWESGLREVRENSKAKLEMKIYNNFTKGWIPLKRLFQLIKIYYNKEITI